MKYFRLPTLVAIHLVFMTMKDAAKLQKMMIADGMLTMQS